VKAATQWPLRRLGEICEFKYGKSLPESARSGGKVPVYGSNGVVGGHDVPLTASETIVIGRKGSHGEVNFSDKPCWPIDTTYFVDSTATKANLNWLKYRLAGAGLNQMNRAAAVPGLNREDAYRVEILLPPPEDQRRIAAILDQAETLRTQRRQALAHLDTLTQSLFLDMFGDPVKGDGRYVVQAVETVASNARYSIVDGPFGSAIKQSDYLDSGIPVIRIGNLTKDGYYSSANLLYIGRTLFESLKRSNVLPGDVLISRVGTLGNTCIYPKDAGEALLSTTGVCKITVNQNVMLAEYLHAAIRCPNFQDQIQKSASTSVQKYFNLSALKNWRIVVPPLTLQQSFATRIQAIEALKATHRTALAQLDALFASLLQRAFAGEL
jgi:type I restriction enzyme, S subunit